MPRTALMCIYTGIYKYKRGLEIKEILGLIMKRIKIKKWMRIL